MSFGFTASPGNASTGPVNYVVNGGGPVNQQPVAQNDTAWTSPGQAVTIPVLANDSDPDGDTLSITSAAQGQHGAVVVDGPAIIYTPASGFTGSDSFAYTISDGRGGSVVASVAVTVSNLTWPAHVFAPYVDMGLYPTYNLVDAAQSQGLKYFNLGFVVADSADKPSWGATPSTRSAGPPSTRGCGRRSTPCVDLGATSPFRSAARPIKSLRWRSPTSTPSRPLISR